MLPQAEATTMRESLRHNPRDNPHDNISHNLGHNLGGNPRGDLGEAVLLSGIFLKVLSF